MSKDNLDNLIAKFYDAQESESIKEDIRIGDDIIASGDKLTPDEAVINNIKRDISKNLKSRQGRRMRMAPLRTAVAAMILLGAFIGIRSVLHLNGPGPDIIYGDIWSPDVKARGFSFELDEIKERIISISLGEDEAESDDMIDSIEFELMDDSGGFWR